MKWIRHTIIFAALICAALSCLTASAHPGDIDPSFGVAGQARTGFGGGPGAGRAMTVQADGKLILAGFSQPNSSNSSFALVRFTANNTLDTSFGVGGSVLTSIGPSNNALANAVQVQPDGKIVAAGSATTLFNESEFALARYNPDGSLDPSFGNAGVVTTLFDVFASEAINAALIQPDGRILVAGSYEESSFSGTAGFALARYNTNGTLDTSFGTGGVVQTALDGAGSINALMLEGDGSIIAAGTSSESFALAHYETNGALDTSFGSGGMTLTPIGVYYSFFGGSAIAYAVGTQIGNFTILNPNKIVLAGQAQLSLGVSGFAVARYNLDGSLDTSFGSGGVVSNVFAPGEFTQNYGQCLLVQGSLLQPRKITVGGYYQVNNTNYFALARLTSSGAFDTSFGAGSGVVTLAATPGGNDQAYAMRSINGQIVLAGSSTTTNYEAEFSAARFNSDGSLDTNFAQAGVLTASTALPSQARALAIQPDGKLLAAGTADTLDASQFALVRFNSDGSLDSAFGASSGKITLPIGPGNAAANALLLQPNGRIVAAGYSSNGTNNLFTLIRCASNGALDPSFGAAGIVATSVGASSSIANAAALQSDGKIIAAGYAFKSGNQNFAVARYTTNGALDTSFAASGFLLTGLGSGASQAHAVAVQTDGKIILAGQAQVGSATNFALARYTSSGSLDNSFGSFGRVTTDFGAGSSSYGYAMAQQPDAKILLAGGVVIGGTEYVALARYSANGSLDATFGSNGEMIAQVGSALDYANALALQKDGRIIVAAASLQGSNNAYAVLRFNSDASPDSSFGTNGQIVIPIVGGDNIANALALDSANRITLAGSSENAFALARLAGDAGPVTLSMTLSSATAAVISWPANSPWTLQQSSNLTAPTWVPASDSTTNDGTNNLLILHPTGAHLFYRLINQ